MNFKKNQLDKNVNLTSVYIAGITTAHTQTLPYRCLKKLCPWCVYSDTNSVTLKTNKDNLPSGENLGKLKDELDGRYIKKWPLTGQKSYVEITHTGEQTIEIAGFTQTCQNVKKLSFDNMCKIVDGNMKNLMIHNPNYFSWSH